MMHKVALTCCLAVLIASGIVQSVSILGPKLLRPYGNYKISIAGGSRAHNLYVAIEGKRSTGEQFSQGRVVQVPAAASRLVDLEIGDPGPGQYKLVARSTSGPLFASSAPLIYQPRSFCVFVQTDKRVYQPRDTVNFRVIALDKYLLPLSGTVDISILDTGGSPVRQWASVPLDRGLFAEELLLADEPALGQWTIQVEARGQKYSRQIMVADYVLPKFEMDLQMPKEILFSDGRFNINVTARHFNGLPVKGELTISAYAVFFSGLLQPVFSTPARKVVDFNGQANVVYDLKTDLDLAEDAARPLVVEAVLEENNTLIKQNITSRILLLRTPYRLKVTAPDRFKPTLPYNVQIELVNSTGHTMNTAGDVVVERLWDDGAPVNTTTVKLNKGIAKYTYTPDVAHTNSTLNLVVKYNEISERIVNVQKSMEKGGQYLTIDVISRDTGVGDEMRAQITATETMDLVHYVVIGRGDILVAKTLELSPARRSVDVSVPVTAAMAPGCILLAWYPRLAGDSVISAAVYAPQKEMLQHKVTVTSASSGQLLRPNGLVEFRVSGEAGSQAALLGSDENAIATELVRENGLGSGLDMQTIEREVESFTGLKHSLFKNEDHLPSLGLDLGGRNSSDVFSNAGMVLLTDGLVIASNNQEVSEEPETGTRAPQAGPYAFSRVPPPPSPRYFLTRTLSPHVTWMFTNLTIGDDGVGTRERWSPVTPGEWSVGAFAVHPTLGLGIAAPRKVTTALPLSLTAELPETLQKGETLAVIVTLKSTLTVDTSVEVTFHNSEQYYEFEPLENNIDSAKKIELYRRLRVTVPARGSISTAFLVTSVRSGEAPIIIEANGNGVSASLFRIINVKDGYIEDIWSWALLDGRRGVARANVTLAPAAGTKLGSVSLEATGDLLANALRALKSPVTVAADATYALRPLARACILLDYLQATDQDDEVTIVKDARLQASTGYQRLMAFRKADGSFAAEIGNDAVSDVWMTSIAARWLSRSSRYVEVSPEATMAAARWLVNAQKPDGSWQPPPSTQKNDPRAQTVVPLTAYALLALQETKSNEVLYKNAMNKALDFLAKNLSPELDAYSLAVTSSALAAARHPQATQALQIMDKYANTSDASTLYWSRKVPGAEWKNPWLKGNSLEASTTAWALRAMLASSLLEEAVPAARYLLQALGPKDQDPDVLDALAQFAETMKTTNKLRVSVTVASFEEPRQFNIDNDNALIIQTQLVRNALNASAVTEGRGVAMVGLAAKGSTNVTGAWPRYTLDPRVDQVSTRERLQLSICIGFVPIANETESGLTLLTVQLPSGYLADLNAITELTAARHVVGARVMAGGARVVAWLRASVGERCATLAAPRALPVARQRPAWVTLTDLYDSSHRARVFYQVPQSTACDVCREWESCASACGSTERQVNPTTTPSPNAANVPGLAFAFALTMAILLLLR
ncbi:C3 and PZP-like alpha-2-macroglobulin domain-containing protein 8 [Maniola jurtina]|uniref:C3 and PZP-like alpha-2-macroglobulin domain-containing protein 8 n=1 Tax=Maniola jurtina TaxID=191418 RepID=UPI001E68B0FD|nr:C3 and PZP-like alpha-2-macroglobulin domain-containing protein 8 [Maniola jurtina]XP_045775067.1 C3 and PZP-like alpha-2-macroglobulin domain-containing protein 8 [Maniola jurtina]